MMRPAVVFLLGIVALTGCQAATRRYYIQAEKDWWSFADGTETGEYINRCTGLNYSQGSELYMQVGVGSRYLKARYVRYMDEDFTTKYEIPADEEHLNIAGPLLRTGEGDTLEVVFRNTLDFDITLTPSGVELAENDTDPVPTNETTTYSWNITDRMAPGKDMASSKLWLYTSAVDQMLDQNMGLIGGLLVTRADAVAPDGRANDTDIEFFTLFHVFDENQNRYFDETLEYYNLTDPLVQTNQTQANWEEANLKHAINGKMFCWNQGFTIPAGKRARWHVAVVGGEPDIHNFHWHGMVLNYTGTTMDQISLFPGGTADMDMVTDNPGTWMIHCHVNDHIHAGMVGLYTLEGDPIVEQDTGDVQQYFIAANEVEWDYAPSMMDMCGSEPANFSDDAAGILVPSNMSIVIGHKHIKALFEEYTDATFTTKKAKDPSLGFLGPTLRAKVGDTIKVTFKNNARFTTGLHPHGVLYAKSSEGAPYDDGTPAASKVDDHVFQGQTYTYTWYVTERTAPGPADGSSVIWMYHSHSHEIQDSYAGLLGAIIVTRKEMATTVNGVIKPKDVDREYVLNFMIVNEASSFMLRQNIATYLPSVPQLQYSQLVGSYASFADSEQFHTINGFMYCNGPRFNATVGEKVRFYIMSLGTEADLHTPSSTLQWTQQGRRSSSLFNLPGQMQTADILPRAAGDFTLQCRTAEHVDAGMIAKFAIQDAGQDLLDNFNGTERVTYISADIEEFNYITSDTNQCTGEAFDDDTAAQWGDGTMGSTFLKAVYREYTDDTFTVRKPQEHASDALAGPTLRAEVGDMITVVFQNNLTFPANLQLSGGLVPVHNGSLIDAPVENGTSVTYQWIVADDNGPAANDLSTVAYSYSSNVNPVGDLYAGLFGAFIVARPGTLQANGLPQGIDELVPLFFNGVDESASSLFDDNLELSNFTVPDELKAPDDYETWSGTTTWQTVNGHVWCTQPDVMLNASSTVRWILVGLGGETGLHTPYFENAILLAQGQKVTTTELAPTVSLTVDMRAEFPGTWKYYCDVQEHFEGGMQGKYTISGPDQQAKFNSNASRRMR